MSFIRHFAIALVPLLTVLATGDCPGQDQIVTEGPVFECPADCGYPVGWVDHFNTPGVGADQWGRTFNDRFPVHGNSDSWYDVAALARAFFINDQRIEFTGLESTFGVEAVLRGEYGHCCGDTLGVVYGELFLNQRFDQNLLTDNSLRESFSHNFDTDTFELSQLAILVQRGNLEFELGRFVTPFGRYYGFSAQNDFFDVPFIRRESILFRETGAQLRWNPDIWRTTLAITNGGPQKDTNSSKAFIGRLGVDLERASLGASIKTQDGIGSEGQKEYKNHVGFDMIYRFTPQVALAGEIIYDEYGLRRPGTLLNDIDWGRSLYNRQLNKGLYQPLTGWGYYINLIGNHSRFDWSLSYGQFLPRAVGDLTHDTPTRQGIGQLYWHLNPMTDLYSSIVIENSIEGLAHQPRSKGLAYSTGLQVRF